MTGWWRCGAVQIARFMAEDFSRLVYVRSRRLRIDRGIIRLLH